MLVKCRCGKQLSIPDSLAGKSAKCPACGNIFKVGGSAEREESTKVIFGCGCGRKLAASMSAIGRKIRCPGCGTEMTIPGPMATPPPPPPAAAPAKQAPPPPKPAPPPADPPSTSFSEDLGLEDITSSDDLPAVKEPEAELSMDAEEPEPKPKAAAPEKKKEEEEGIYEPETYVIAGPKCPSCGMALDAGVQFCVHCGTDLVTGTKVAAMTTPEEKKPKERLPLKIKLIIAAAVAVVALAGGLTAFFLTRPGKPASPAEPPPTTTTVPADPRAAATGAPKKDPNEGYLENIVYAPGRVREKMNDLGLAQTVQAFEAENGRRPRDLKELTSAGYHLPKPPAGMQYEYDAATGELYRVKAEAK